MLEGLKHHLMEPDLFKEFCDSFIAEVNRARLSWDALKEQWGQGYSRDRNFRRDFAQEVSQIREIFPKLPITITEEGCIITPAGPDVLALPIKRAVRK